MAEVQPVLIPSSGSPDRLAPPGTGSADGALSWGVSELLARALPAPPAPCPHGIRVAEVRGVEAPGDRHRGGGSHESRDQVPSPLSGSDL